MLTRADCAERRISTMGGSCEHEDVRSKGRLRGWRVTLGLYARPEVPNRPKGERPMPVEHHIAMDTHCRTTEVCVKTRANTPGRTWQVPTTIPALREAIASFRPPR